jgi:hypothetical protein
MTETVSNDWAETGQENRNTSASQTAFRILLKAAKDIRTAIYGKMGLNKEMMKMVPAYQIRKRNCIGVEARKEKALKL